MDGNLDEPVWNSAASASLSRNTDGAHVKVGATVKIFRDDSSLYFGFTCPEPDMANLKATATDRDGSVYDDDSVEVFLAPNDPGLPYFHFIVGAAGGASDDRSGSKAWNTHWTWAAGRGPDAWTAEIAIPFSSLNASPAGRWRANFMRNRRPSGPSFINWSTTYGNYHNPDRFGSIDF
jgi:hypothetical protein